MHAVANTPVGLMGPQSLGSSPTSSGLPRMTGGSAPTLPVSRPVRRSRTVTACLLAASPDATLLHRSVSARFVASSPRSDCFRLERPIAGWDSHPLEPAVFPRHTVRSRLGAPGARGRGACSRTPRLALRSVRPQGPRLHGDAFIDARLAGVLRLRSGVRSSRVRRRRSGAPRARRCSQPCVRLVRPAARRRRGGRRPPGGDCTGKRGVRGRTLTPRRSAPGIRRRRAPCRVDRRGCRARS